MNTGVLSDPLPDLPDAPTYHMQVEAAAEAAARVVRAEAALAEVQAERNAAGSDDEQLRRDFDRMVEAAVAVREEVRTGDVTIRGGADEQLRRDFDSMVTVAVAVREEVRTGAGNSLLLYNCKRWVG